MTFEELHEILDNENKKLSIEELKEVIYELKQDCCKNDMIVTDNYSQGKCYKETYISDSRYYTGEQNAFQIVLDLLEHFDENKVDHYKIEEAKKETANEILEEVSSFCKENYQSVPGCDWKLDSYSKRRNLIMQILYERIKIFVKKYGVEVEK